MDFKTALEGTLLPKEADNFLLELQQESFLTLFLNTNKMSSTELLRRYPLLEPASDNDHVFVNKHYPNLTKSLEHLSGAIYFQDYASSMVVKALDLKVEDKILDMCAAPGGKSINASVYLKNQGLIISNELSEKRLINMYQNYERMGLSNLLITHYDANQLPFFFDSCFDKIILDAPCSGTFMFRKEPKMAADWTYSKVQRLQEEQRKLLQNALKMLKVNGILVYATCSVLKEENEDIITSVLNDDYQIVPLEFKTAFKSRILDGAVRIMPSSYSEGQFICLLKKVKGQAKGYKETSLNLLEDLPLYKFTTKEIIYGVATKLIPANLTYYSLGVRAYDLKGESKIPNHYLSRFLDSRKSISLTKDEVGVYLSGNILNKEHYLGYFVVSYQGLNLGWVKSTGTILKNLYPKGLRLPAFSFFDNYQ